MLSNITAFGLFQRAQLPASSFGTDSSTSADVDYWRKAMPSVRSPQELVADNRLFRVLTKAFGYSSDDAPPLEAVQAALEGGVSNRQSIASANPDDRLEKLVRQVAFAEYGVSGLRRPAVIETVARLFVERSGDGSVTTSSDTPNNPDAAYFLENIRTITSPDDLLADFRMYRFALEAFGLEDRIENTTLMRQVLADGYLDDSDIVNQLGDPDLVEFTRVFGFGESGALNIVNPEFGGSIVRRTEIRETLDAIRAGNTPRDEDDPETDYFRRAILSVESAEDLVTDRRLYAYVMTAFDLGGDVANNGLVARVLSEGASAPESLANRLPDPRYRDLAQSIGIAEFGTRNLRDLDVIESIVRRYQRVRAEQEAGREQPAVEQAAYFDRKAQQVSSWLSIVADQRLRDVAFTALDIPSAAGALEPDRIVKMLEARFDVADLGDPRGRARFIDRYLAQSEAAAGVSTNIRGAGAISVLTGGASVSGAGLYGLISQL